VLIGVVTPQATFICDLMTS